MAGTVVVALPAVGEEVYDISSEKIPHLTICYLGEDVSNADFAKVLEFVAHASSDLDPFWLNVDYRGELGADQADVLFFENNQWDIKGVREFRSSLLKNDTIARLYNSAEQFEGWTPHLTLGYPEAPAKETKDKKIHSVSFDRLAVWHGDFTGPEIRLRHETHGPDAVDSVMAMGEEAVGELFHYGVKGMRWGVTTVDRAGSVTKTSEKKALMGKRPVVVTQKRAGRYVTAKGGQRHTASNDAIKAQAGRRIAKKSTTDALSNDELKSTIERMRLEQEFKKLDSKVSRRGNNFLTKLFLPADGKITVKDLQDQVTKEIARRK